MRESRQHFINRYVQRNSEISVGTAATLGASIFNSMTPDPDLEPTEFKDEDSLLKRIFIGSVSPFFLPQDLFTFQYANIFGGVGLGFGFSDNFDVGSARYDSALRYQKNIESFSGAKTFQQTIDLSRAVFNEDGTKRAFKAFKDIALNINSNYNINWLKTEQNAAFRIAQSAENWHSIQEDKE